MNGLLCLRGPRLASCSLAGLFAAIGLSLTAQAQTVGTLVQVTGADPFTTCTADNLHRQETVFGSIVYPDTAIEPWVAADPTDASRLLVAHQQDRFDDGGSRGLVGVVSNDAAAAKARALTSGGRSPTFGYGLVQASTSCGIVTAAK